MKPALGIHRYRASREAWEQICIIVGANENDTANVVVYTSEGEIQFKRNCRLIRGVEKYSAYYTDG
jgi:hypothetical protein